LGSVAAPRPSEKAGATHKTDEPHGGLSARYGRFVADNGTNWYLTGSADRRWNDNDLDQLKSVPGSAFEAVETGEPIRR